MIISVSDRPENKVGKGENVDYQHFLYFPQCFQKASLKGLGLSLTNPSFNDPEKDGNLHFALFSHSSLHFKNIFNALSYIKCCQRDMSGGQ